MAKQVQLDLLEAAAARKQKPQKQAVARTAAIPEVSAEEPRLTEYIGAIHIHTKYFDGSGTVEQITDAASAANVDFIIISDHDSLEARRHGHEGWNGRVLVLVDEEVSSKAHHCLALGLTEVVTPSRIHPDYHLDAVKKQDGLIFAAHPARGSTGLLHVTYRTWENIEDERLDGVELWSYMVDWASGFSRLNPFETFKRIRKPETAITGPPPQLVQDWDYLTTKRRMPIIGSVDAHAAKYLMGLVTIFPYDVLMRTLRTHILCNSFAGTWQEDKEKVYDALKQGRSFIAYDYLHPANGFRFQCIHRDFTLEMGEASTYQPGLQLEIQVPFEADIRLIRNGGELMRTTGRELVVPANGSGVYRVEAYMEQKPWIFSNPIYIREAADV